jgi:hypothetical protein
VCRYNGWGLATPYDRTVARLEAHTIRAADALIAPSDYLARQVSALYGVERATIERIRYPIGDVPRLERSAEIWHRGTILYVGRMEPRKGVLEWIDAAVALATERPHLRFEFVGADTTLTGQDDGPSVRDAVAARVPASLTGSFTFHDAEARPLLWARLARAQLVVVPSRWDNLPNTGLEAMASGLPVLASPEGGLAEIIEDDRTGWLAASQQPAELLSTLRRALDTPAEVRARMGAAAADDIRHVCGDADVVARHLEFRRRVAAAGAVRSPSVPRSGSADILEGGDGPRQITSRAEAVVVQASAGKGIAVILVDEGDEGFDGCDLSLAAQSQPPVSVIRVECAEDVPGAVQALCQSADRARGVALVGSGWRLAPEFLASCELMLERHPQVGLVSTWFSADSGWPGPEIRPAPAWPYQWIDDDASPCSVLRLSALRTSGWASEALEGEVVVGDLALAIVAGGWDAVTCPAYLSWRAHQSAAGTIARRAAASARRRRCWADAGWPGLSRDSREALLRVAGSGGTVHPSSVRGAWTPGAALRQPLDVQLRLIGRAIRNPSYAAAWLVWHVRRAWRHLRGRHSGRRV